MADWLREFVALTCVCCVSQQNCLVLRQTLGTGLVAHWRFGVVLVWFDLVWFGLVLVVWWFGGLVWLEMAWLVWCGVVWCGVVWRVSVWDFVVLVWC